MDLRSARNRNDRRSRRRTAIPKFSDKPITDGRNNCLNGFEGGGLRNQNTPTLVEPHSFSSASSKTKNLCRFTLNENLINDLQGGGTDGANCRLNSADTDDDVNSVIVMADEYVHSDERCFTEETSHCEFNEGQASKSKATPRGVLPLGKTHNLSRGPTYDGGQAVNACNKSNATPSVAQGALPFKKTYDMPYQIPAKMNNLNNLLGNRVPYEINNSTLIKEILPSEKNVNNEYVLGRNLLIKSVNSSVPSSATVYKTSSTQTTVRTNSSDALGSFCSSNVPQSSKHQSNDVKSSNIRGLFKIRSRNRMKSMLEKTSSVLALQPNKSKPSALTNQILDACQLKNDTHHIEKFSSSTSVAETAECISRHRMETVPRSEPGNPVLPKQTCNGVALSDLFRTDDTWKDNLFRLPNNRQDSPPDKCRNTESRVNAAKESTRESLMFTLLEVLGNDSHIAEKLRNSTPSKYDPRFRNVRTGERTSVSAAPENATKSNSRSKNSTCNNYRSNDDELVTIEPLTDLYKNDDVASTLTYSSQEKSVPETFSSAMQFADAECSKQSTTRYCKRKTCISLRRCTCEKMKCYQLDELHDSITSMQSELKKLLANMPAEKNSCINISYEIAKLKDFYHECQKYEHMRSIQHRKLEYHIKEIYRKIDGLTEARRGTSFFKYIVLFPMLSILTFYAVSCLGELKRN